ncbi:MAG TPA: FliM/FliN family flagellar motor switch protein [Terriglobia bacterium]|nr:FliM/FliN family flagellar motor switch protein [Terriglobia bacterium]
MAEGTTIAESALERILDVEVPVTVRFGGRQMSLEEVLQLGHGAEIQLDKMVDDPVELFINRKLLATGEVVVVDGRYAIRITDIVSPADRIQSLSE